MRLCEVVGGIEWKSCEFAIKSEDCREVCEVV